MKSKFKILEIFLEIEGVRYGHLAADRSTRSLVCLTSGCVIELAFE
jgi:hypothetical protein